ncbi:response regulator [Alkalibacillus aidingensis]|uniref:response regulator n=1 Tax=Alkalibacillus aidingensis TaxID=2747607 RepID=UPI0016604EF6|nr:response regulator [Alkalibacillus aidingensis]
MSTIALIEPKHIVRNALKNRLTDEGYYVFDFESLDKLFLQLDVLVHVDLILLTQYDLANYKDYVKRIQKQRTIPIVLLSDHLNKEEVNEAMDYGVIDFILLPIDYEDLVMRVSKILPISSVTLKVDDLLENEIARAQRGDYSVSIVVIEAKANNSFSYNQSLKIMKWLKEECSDALRKTDMVTEFGDKVLIFLPMTSIQGVHTVVKKNN